MFLEMTTFNLRYIWSSPTLISGSLNKSVILGRLEWCDFGCWKYQSKTCWCCRFCWCWQWRACWPLVGDSWQLGNSLPCSATARQKLFSTFTFSFQYFFIRTQLVPSLFVSHLGGYFVKSTQPLGPFCLWQCLNETFMSHIGWRPISRA